MARKRKLTGEAYWALTDLMEKGEEKIKEYGEWARKECRRLKLIPDRTDLVHGVVYDEPADSNDPRKTRKQVENVKDEDVITQAIAKSRELDEINKEMSKLVRKIAMAAKVRADQINPKAGEIIVEEDDVEYVEVNLSE